MRGNKLFQEIPAVLLSLDSLALLLLLNLQQQRSVDMWKHTTKRNSSFDECI